MESQLISRDKYGLPSDYSYWPMTFVDDYARTTGGMFAIAYMEGFDIENFIDEFAKSETGLDADSLTSNLTGRGDLAIYQIFLGECVRRSITIKRSPYEPDAIEKHAVETIGALYRWWQQVSHLSLSKLLSQVPYNIMRDTLNIWQEEECPTAIRYLVDYMSETKSIPNCTLLR